MKLFISEGNTKLGKIPNLSLPPGLTCPKNVPCRKTCYARRIYQRLEAVHAKWLGNLELWRTDPNTYMEDLNLWLELHTPPVFRIHVSGDFPGQRYLDHLCTVIAKHPDTKFLAFTKRHNLDFTRVPDNFRILLSMWNNWGDENQAGPKAWYLDPDDPDPRIPDSAYPCSGSCDSCFKCWNLKDHESVVLKKH